MKARTAAIVLIAVAATAIGGAMLPRLLRGSRAAVGIDPAEYPVRGIDLSAHNGRVDFSRVADAGIDFAILKASEGATWRDSLFERNYAAAMDAGLRVGAYHFFRFDVDGWRQSVNILRALGARHLDLPVAIDVEEWANPPDATTAEVVANLRSLVELLRQNGREPMIYTNKNGYYRFIRGRFDDVALWICSFTNPPLADQSRWTLWQHSHIGRVAGVRGPVDISTYNSPRRAPYSAWLDSVPSLARLTPRAL
ncbi:MAG: hypothetical protein NC406_00930 [Bacteroides sp.]|nr:hypothetical protein [Bacteroides sp.]MCM1095343.1 hypothetical protein [Terasakiella sp.]